ncbi:MULTISPECIES: LacI family DNA-binding transcriptional regulator [unclassified Knoellia]|uniref:LacI family DNA-binding transcriptional regulator n=1 Tax=Knoellia altitudinis TaxID=3404795 RepID=UPI0036186B53
MASRPSARSRATVNDVASAARVSRQTVSNALMHPERVRPETLRRVHAEIERLGYSPSTAASSLRQQRAGAVGMELTGLGSQSLSDALAPFLVSLTICAPTHECHIVTFGSDQDGPTLERYREMWRGRLVDAFVIMDTHHGDPRPTWLADQGIPFASFGRVWDEPAFTAWADVDGRAGTDTAVEHLVSEGYGPIGYLGWPYGSLVGDERREGWAIATARHGRGDLTLQAISNQVLPEAIDAAGQLVDRVGTGGAIVCASDLLALAVHHVLLTRGLRPGRDVGIVGFDGSQSALAHGLTSVAQPFRAIADELLTQVHDQLTSAPQRTSGVMLTPTLVHRSSSHRRPTAPATHHQEKS